MQKGKSSCLFLDWISTREERERERRKRVHGTFHEKNTTAFLKQYQARSVCKYPIQQAVPKNEPSYTASVF